jgi:hypothetical protein
MTDRFVAAWEAGEIDAEDLPEAWEQSEPLRDHLFGNLVRSVTTLGNFSLAGDLAEDLGDLLTLDEVQALKTRLIAETGREISEWEEEFEFYFGD